MMKEYFLFVVVLLSLSISISECSQEDIQQLFQSYFDWKLESNPTEATRWGYHKYAEDIDDQSLAGIKKIGEGCVKFRDLADNLSKEPESDPSDAFYLKILQSETNSCIQRADSKGNLFPPVGFLFGFQTESPNFFGEPDILKWDTIEDYQRALRRLKKVPTEISQIIDLLKIGIQEKIVYSNESLSRVKDQFEKIQVESAEDSEYYKQFKAMAENLKIAADSTQIQEIRDEAKEIIKNEILPAFRDLYNFIENEYMLHFRPSPGLSALPDGLKIYQEYLDYHTSVKGLTADEIHQIGLDEVKELRKNVSKVISDLGYSDLSIQDFFQKIRLEEKYQFNSKEEIVEYLKGLIQKINVKLSDIFGPEVLQPEILEVNVKISPSTGGVLAYYKQSSIDGRRKGSFYISVKNVTSWKKYDTMALTLHEANPGHNLQFEYKKFSRIPQFIRANGLNWFLPGGPPKYSAFIEGWGLYCEYLGHELQLYKDDPIQLIGFYSLNLMRAARLVVDTGLHAFGWSRQDAIDYLVANSALSKDVCEEEINRYITNPGQATSYKIGERKIKEVRQKLETELSSNFNIKHFHQSVLECMGPLDALEECVKLYLRILNPITTEGPKATRENH